MLLEDKEIDKQIFMMPNPCASSQFNNATMIIYFDIILIFSCCRQVLLALGHTIRNVKIRLGSKTNPNSFNLTQGNHIFACCSSTFSSIHLYSCSLLHLRVPELTLR